MEGSVCHAWMEVILVIFCGVFVWVRACWLCIPYFHGTLRRSFVLANGYFAKQQGWNDFIFSKKECTKSKTQNYTWCQMLLLHSSKVKKKNMNILLLIELAARKSIPWFFQMAIVKQRSMKYFRSFIDRSE